MKPGFTSELGKRDRYSKDKAEDWNQQYTKPPSCMLEEKFRHHLLDFAIKKEGSKYSLAMKLGYASVGSGKAVNDWYDGYAKIPFEKLQKLSFIVGIPMEEILLHQTTQNVRQRI